MQRSASLTPTEARRRAERAAALLAQDSRVRLVYVFGSTIDPARSAVRDVDVAVLTETPLSLDELTRRRAELVAAADAPVDLVSLNEASIVLAHEVAETGVCLYARDDDVETEFITGARARYWDFKPYLEEQWRLAGERLAERRGSQA